MEETLHAAGIILHHVIRGGFFLGHVQHAGVGVDLQQEELALLIHTDIRPSIAHPAQSKVDLFYQALQFP